MLTPGNLVLIKSTGEKGIVSEADYHTSVIDIIGKNKSIHYLNENLEVLNKEVSLEDTDTEEIREIKHRYVEWISDKPRNYKQDWTEEHIKRVAEVLDSSNKKNRPLLAIKLAVELKRSIGGIQWMYRRLFVKAGNNINISERIKSVIEELGLLGG